MRIKFSVKKALGCCFHFWPWVARQMLCSMLKHNLSVYYNAIFLAFVFPGPNERHIERKIVERVMWKLNTALLYFPHYLPNRSYKTIMETAPATSVLSLHCLVVMLNFFPPFTFSRKAKQGFSSST